MNQATNVNIVPSYGQRGDLHFSQYDVGRTATINLYAVNEAYTIPLGATVKIQATKPSGLGFDVACTFSGSVVTVVSTETMTAEAGRFPCELQITKDSDVIGTANFMFIVEASPHPDGVIDGDAEEVVNEIKALVLQSEGYALGTQDGVPVDSSSVYYHNNAKWLSDNAILSDEVKQTLLQCFEKVAWIDGNGQTYYDALQTALNRGAELLSISAVYTQSGTVYDTDSLDSLKPDLVVTGTYDGGETETILTYTLSGSLTVGTSTITVSYGGKTTTFTVTVTQGALYPMPNGTHTFTGTGFVGRTIAVTDHSHVKYTNSNAVAIGSDSGTYGIFNDVTDNSASAGATNINSPSDTLFTLHAGDQVVFEISNIQYTGLGTEADNRKYAIALRSGSTSIVSTGDLAPTDTSKTVTQTISSDKNITCLFLFGGKSISSLEFDVSLTVNGVKWI